MARQELTATEEALNVADQHTRELEHAVDDDENSLHFGSGPHPDKFYKPEPHDDELRQTIHTMLNMEVKLQAHRNFEVRSDATWVNRGVLAANKRVKQFYNTLRLLETGIPFYPETVSKSIYGGPAKINNKTVTLPGVQDAWKKATSGNVDQNNQPLDGLDDQTKGSIHRITDWFNDLCVRRNEAKKLYGFAKEAYLDIMGYEYEVARYQGSTPDIDPNKFTVKELGGTDAQIEATSGVTKE